MIQVPTPLLFALIEDDDQVTRARPYGVYDTYMDDVVVTFSEEIIVHEWLHDSAVSLQCPVASLLIRDAHQYGWLPIPDPSLCAEVAAVFRTADLSPWSRVLN
ncbi:hypothetical protein V8E36_007685 [Tilletia maclaganii]